MSVHRLVACSTMTLVVALTFAGCRRPATSAPVPPDYARPLDGGRSGLRLLPPDQWPDLEPGYRSRDDRLIIAIDRSLDWFTKPSTRRYYPLGGITHAHAHASVLAFRHAVLESPTYEAFRQRLGEEFDVYTSIGWNGRGDVLYTAYYTPILQASRQATARFRFPLYAKPADLVTDPQTGRTLGRMVNGEVVPYPARREIEQNNLLRGQELVWLEDRFEQYLAHIQGSARLILPDGTMMDLGYGGNNGYEYTSVAQALVREGRIDPNRLSLPVVRQYFRDHPEDLEKYLNLNQRFIFFKPYDAAVWPAGSLGFKVSPMRTVATDKTVFPAGAVALVATRIPMPDTQSDRPFDQFVVDQDSGGAIRAAGRADLYIGIGEEAEKVAGQVYDEGRLYYILLKAQSLPQWQGRLSSPTR
jgi:membrane-bound lytic murein transglycosylase A